jgi:hypothetical protein
VARQDEIRLIAYSLWEQENCPNGKDCEHWFKAEAIWEEYQKTSNENIKKELESKKPKVLITPPPNQIKLLLPPVKRSIRTRRNKK